MRLDEPLMHKFCVAKSFRENDGKGDFKMTTSLPVNHLHFSTDGLHLITSSEDDQIIIYDVERGTQKRLLNSQKYGVDHIHFTHTRNAAIHSSTKRDDAIRYLSLHDNKFIRYFSGHTKRVNSLAMSPSDDTFISGSLDSSVRLWDLRSPNCVGIMQVQGKPVVAFDPEGLVFAVGVHSEQVKLYDLKSFEKGPFATFKLPQEKKCEWTGLRFSPGGKTLLLNTNGNVIRLLDAFDGVPLQTFAGHFNNKGIALDGGFSPDSKFVLSGSTDGRIHVWNAESGYKICVLNGGHVGPVTSVQFNPKFMMMASSCSHLNMWLPKES